MEAYFVIEEEICITTDFVNMMISEFNKSGNVIMSNNNKYYFELRRNNACIKLHSDFVEFKLNDNITLCKYTDQAKNIIASFFKKQKHIEDINKIYDVIREFTKK